MRKILFGVPQESILGPLLFNIFLCDLFYMMSDTDFASYADDNTPYVSADTIDEVIKRLETASVKLFKWFADNQMKANQDKCHLIVSKNENISMHIGPFEIKNTNCEKLLGIKVDSRLNFNEHLDGIIKKASRKINALYRITPFMNISKRRILMNSFFNSQFNYCPLVWMFHSRSINNKTNRLHERALRIVYNDFKSSFKNLLEKDGTVSIHVSNLQKLAREMFKISKNFSVPLMSELFHQKVNHYDLQNSYEFSIPNVHRVFHGQASITYLGPLIWQLVPSELKDFNTVSAFRVAIRKSKPNKCPRRKCWIYLNYLFGINNRCRVECEVFLPGFLVEGFFVNGCLVFLKCFIFIFIFLIFKFVFVAVNFCPIILVDIN